jgi:hypothetical protein
VASTQNLNLTLIIEASTEDDKFLENLITGGKSE